MLHVLDVNTKPYSFHVKTTNASFAFVPTHNVTIPLVDTHLFAVIKTLAAFFLDHVAWSEVGNVRTAMCCSAVAFCVMQRTTMMKCTASSLQRYRFAFILRATRHLMPLYMYMLLVCNSM